MGGGNRNSARQFITPGGRPATSEWHGYQSATTDGLSGSKASFYVTNFPDNIPLFRLRQAFEVCGMLSDVYIARYRNARGQEFGFVRYVNVKNKAKLSRALNNISIGQCRILAREARYDRFAHNDVVRAEGVRDVKGGVKCDFVESKPVVRGRGEGIKNVRVEQEVVEARGEGEIIMRVGTVDVPALENGRKFKLRRLEGGARGVKDEQVVAGRGEDEEKACGKKSKGGLVVESLEGVSHKPLPTVSLKQQMQTVTQFTPAYKSRDEDLKWAKSGMVASIFTGDSVLALQQRMDDAGFRQVIVTPMGGDKVFLHCNGKEDVWQVFNESIDFFSLLFSNIQKWSANTFTYERGAWIRVYGVPVHAWNNDFFALCVSGVGKFIQADEGTAVKERLDFARILVSTSHLEIIAQSTNFYIDGCKFCVIMREEWGYSLGEDAFLTEVEPEPLPEDDMHSKGEVDLDEVEGEWELDDLVTDLQKEWSHHGGKKDESRIHDDVQLTSCERKEEGALPTAPQRRVVAAQPPIQQLHLLKCSETNKIIGRNEAGLVSAAVQRAAPTQMQPEQMLTRPVHHASSPENSKTVGSKEEGTVFVGGQQAAAAHVQPKRIQLESCHVTSNHSSLHTSQKEQEIKGPWSLHWLSKKPISEGGNVFTSTSKGGVNQSRNMARDSYEPKSLSLNHKKGGVVNYPMGFMKKIARMQVSERKQILKILNKQKSKRRVRKGGNNSKAAAISSSESSKNSTSSVNKDWENWVLVRGNAVKVAEDVKDIGRTVGLSYECELNNGFNLLTKEGRREWRTLGGTEVKGSDRGKGSAVEGC